MTRADHLAMFIAFMVREGYAPFEAKFEFNVMYGKTLKEYTKATRYGASFTLNRRKRISLYSLFESARKHARVNAEVAALGIDITQ